MEMINQISGYVDLGSLSFSSPYIYITVMTLVFIKACFISRPIYANVDSPNISIYKIIILVVLFVSTAVKGLLYI